MQEAISFTCPHLQGNTKEHHSFSPLQVKKIATCYIFHSLFQNINRGKFSKICKAVIVDSNKYNHNRTKLYPLENFMPSLHGFGIF